MQPKLRDFLRVSRSELVSQIDVDHGLLSKLFERRILTQEHVDDIQSKPTVQKRNETLLDLLAFRDDQYYEMFREELAKKQNGLVVRYLPASSESDLEPERKRLGLGAPPTESIDETFENGDIRPLTEKEKSKLNLNMFCLLKLLDPFKMQLLYRLLDNHCIKDKQLDKILSPPEKNKEQQTYELLTILKRGSIAHFKKFIQCLKDTLQENIAIVLERSGAVMAIHVDLNIRENKVAIENNLASILTGCSMMEELELQEQQKPVLEKILNYLSSVGIQIVGAIRTESLLVYVFCQTMDSMNTIEQILKSGDLRTIFEELFNSLVKCDITFTMEVTTDEKENEESVNYFRDHTSSFGYSVDSVQLDDATDIDENNEEKSIGEQELALAIIPYHELIEEGFLGEGGFGVVK